jgi:pilus assembly protein Flp/PilA
MYRFYSAKRRSESGQGLVEYSLILALVAVVVIAVLMILGPSVGNVFSQIVDEISVFGGKDNGDDSGDDVVVVTKADYNSTKQELHLDATSDGGYDSSVVLTASPGGVMEAKTDHYHLKYTLAGCPCEVTVTSSKGGSATVMVGP